MESENYKITVSEPWEFRNSNGENGIYGKILGRKGNNCLLFKSNTLLKFGKSDGQILVLFPRSYDEDFTEIKNKPITVNGGLFAGDYHSFSAEELEIFSKFVIIGQLMIVDEM